MIVVIYLWIPPDAFNTRLGTRYRVLLTVNNSVVLARRYPKWFVSFPMVFCFLFCFESANKNPHPHRVLYTIKLQKTLNNNDRYNVYLHPNKQNIENMYNVLLYTLSVLF